MFENLRVPDGGSTDSVFANGRQSEAERVQLAALRAAIQLCRQMIPAGTSGPKAVQRPQVVGLEL